MTVMTRADVLRTVRQWPLDEQMSIAEELLRGLRTALRVRPAAQKMEGLAPLDALNLQELRVLAEAVVAPDHQERLRVLLEGNRSGVLASREQTELDSLLAEVDQVALLKARARYSMSLLSASSERGR